MPGSLLRCRSGLAAVAGIWVMGTAETLTHSGRSSSSRWNVANGKKTSES